METSYTKFYYKTENATVHKCALNRGWRTVQHSIILRTVTSLSGIDLNICVFNLQTPASKSEAGICRLHGLRL